MLGDRRYCYPLTVTDHASRYLLLCEAMESNAEKTALPTKVIGTHIESLNRGSVRQRRR
jgi:hypothetical protein